MIKHPIKVDSKEIPMITNSTIHTFTVPTLNMEILYMIRKNALHKPRL